MRRPLETRLLDLIETHPLAASLSAGAAYTWLRLGRAIERAEDLDTFRLRPGLATLEQLARAFRLSVTETARGLDELIRKGCLLVVEGSFKLPAWTGVASPKALAARANGQKRAPSGDPSRQRRLPLLTAIPGGGPSVTDWVTHATASSKTFSKKEEEVVAREPVSVTQAEAVTQELGQLAGLNAAQIRRSVEQVGCWLEAGVSAEVMRAAVCRVMRRANLPPITGLSYFSGAIEDAASSRPPIRPQLETVDLNPVEQRARQAWSRKTLAWNDNGRVGPRPRLEDFLEPARPRAAA